MMLQVQVAVKTILKTLILRDLSELLNDVSVMCSFDHKHLTSIYGLVLTNDSVLLVSNLTIKIHLRPFHFVYILLCFHLC